MTLHFPNPSRSYDASRRGIAFWGHDDTLEVPFFLDESAILQLDPHTQKAEAGMLATFDAAKGLGSGPVTRGREQTPVPGTVR